MAQLCQGGIAIAKDFAKASVNGNLCITNVLMKKYSLRSYSHYFGIANANANSIAIAQCEWTLTPKQCSHFGDFQDAESRT